MRREEYTFVQAVKEALASLDKHPVAQRHGHLFLMMGDVATPMEGAIILCVARTFFWRARTLPLIQYVDERLAQAGLYASWDPQSDVWYVPYSLLEHIGENMRKDAPHDEDS